MNILYSSTYSGNKQRTYYILIAAAKALFLLITISQSYR